MIVVPVSQPKKRISKLNRNVIKPSRNKKMVLKSKFKIMNPRKLKPRLQKLKEAPQAEKQSNVSSSDCNADQPVINLDTLLNDIDLEERVDYNQGNIEYNLSDKEQCDNFSENLNLKVVENVVPESSQNNVTYEYSLDHDLQPEDNQQIMTLVELPTTGINILFNN